MPIGEADEHLDVPNGSMNDSTDLLDALERVQAGSWHFMDAAA